MVMNVSERSRSFIRGRVFRCVGYSMGTQDLPFYLLSRSFKTHVIRLL